VAGVYNMMQGVLTIKAEIQIKVAIISYRGCHTNADIQNMINQ